MTHKSLPSSRLENCGFVSVSSPLILLIAGDEPRTRRPNNTISKADTNRNYLESIIQTSFHHILHPLSLSVLQSVRVFFTLSILSSLYQDGYIASNWTQITVQIRKISHILFFTWLSSLPTQEILFFLFCSFIFGDSSLYASLPLYGSMRWIFQLKFYIPLRRKRQQRSTQ